MSAGRADEPRERGGGEQVAPELTGSERRKVERQSSGSARTTYAVILEEGEQELERSWRGLAWSGLAAGLSMGFSLVAEGILHAALPDAPWRPLVAKLGYSIGFLIVVLGSQQLFTENTLTPIVPLLSRRSEKGAPDVLRLWAVVLVTNLVGTILFAWLIARTSLFAPELHRAFEEIGREGVRGTFGETVIRGVFAGWLIALMVWMLPASEGSRVLVILIMTWLIGAARLAHIIAGSVDTQYLVARGLLSFGDYLGRFVAPTLIGNLIGGTTLVAALNHAQVVSGEER